MKGQIQKELERKDPYPAPLVTSLPPINSKMDLYHATLDQEVADQELMVKKISMKKIYLGCDWDWHQLDKNKAALGNLFKASNHAVKDNRASMSRFREIIREKALDKEELSDQILMARLEVMQYREVMVQMQRYVSEYSVYEKFLELVTRDANEFNSVGDVLNRYESLEATSRECLRTLEVELGEATAIRRRMTELVEQGSARLKNLSNNLITLQVRKKEAELRRRQWERVVGRIRGMIALNEERRLELAGGCYDLYRQSRARRNEPQSGAVAPDDTTAQLDYIRQTVLFYKEVNTIAQAAKQAQDKANGPSQEHALTMDTTL